MPNNQSNDPADKARAFRARMTSSHQQRVQVDSNGRRIDGTPTHRYVYDDRGLLVAVEPDDGEG